MFHLLDELHLLVQQHHSPRNRLGFPDAIKSTFNEQIWSSYCNNTVIGFFYDSLQPLWIPLTTQKFSKYKLSPLIGFSLAIPFLLGSFQLLRNCLSTRSTFNGFPSVFQKISKNRLIFLSFFQPFKIFSKYKLFFHKFLYLLENFSKYEVLYISSHSPRGF